MKAEDSQQTMSRGSNPGTARSAQCTNARILLENRHFVQLLGTLGAPSRRQSRLSMSLQQHEIGLEACPPRRPRNPVAGVPENCNIEFGLWKPNPYDFGSQESHLIHGPRLNHRGHRDHGENPEIASRNIELIALNSPSPWSLCPLWLNSPFARTTTPSMQDTGLGHGALLCVCYVPG